MKRALLLSVCLLVVASMAFAQAGSIGVFADPAGASCNLTDTAPGLKLVYVVHVYSPGATASQFRVTADAGMLMTYLAEAVTAPYIKIGTCAGPAGTGCAIAYGSCVASPNMVLTVQYFASGLTTPCAMFHVLPDISTIPPKTSVLVTNCAVPTPALLIATGGEAYVNNNGSCPCNVPVEETSWGQIKSLYQ
ncbi:MAG: hypothetical protein ABIA59_03860 [Candidatus Latescibacterota bacterium]